MGAFAGMCMVHVQVCVCGSVCRCMCGYICLQVCVSAYAGMCADI